MLVLNYILLENIFWKQKEGCLYLYTMKFYLQFWCVTVCLKHNNDTPNLTIHKHTNYKMIKLYIDRLRTTTQIFIAMDYLITMSESYVYFRKRFDKYIRFPPRRSNWIHELWKYFSNFVFFRFLTDMHKSLKEIGIIKGVSRLKIFWNLRTSNLCRSLH